MKTAHRLFVLLPEATQIAQFILLMRLVVDRMKNNPHFPNPIVPLSLVEQHLDTFEAHAVLAENGGTAAIDLRNASLVVVQEDMSLLRAYAQRTVNALPVADAEAAITSVGFEVRKKAKRTKEAISVKHGKVSGSAVLEAKALPRPTIYWWQMSTDGETWSNVAETFHARATISGLTPATVYHFRLRAKTRGTIVDWSQPIQLIAL